MSEQRKWHTVMAGDLEAARLHGLTIKATCGKVWVPTVLDDSQKLDLEHCAICYAPKPAFVYRCFAADGSTVYIGCTVAPKTRLATHRSNSWWWPLVDRTRVLVFRDKQTALHKESMAIWQEAPLCNTRGVDLEAMTADELQQRLDRLASVSTPERLTSRIVQTARQIHGVELEVAA